MPLVVYNARDESNAMLSMVTVHGAEGADSGATGVAAMVAESGAM